MMVKEVNKDVSLPDYRQSVPEQMPWMMPYQQAPPGSFQFGLSTPTPPVQSQQQLPHSLESNVFSAYQGLPSTGLVNTLTSTTTIAAPAVQQPILPPHVQPANQYSSTFLTHMPTLTQPARLSSHKRGSTEMDLDSGGGIPEHQPPAKQLLSEQKLFKKFGSLQLKSSNGDKSFDSMFDEEDESDEEQDFECNPLRSAEAQTSGNDESDDLNRYVYILYKDKKAQTNSLNPNHLGHCNTPLDRLARQEREKLSKALVLWSPPPTLSSFNNLVNATAANNSDDDDDDHVVDADIMT